MTSASGSLIPWRRVTLAASLVASLALLGDSGCSPTDADPHRLVIATPWPPALRSACEAAFADDGGHHPIQWVELGRHRWSEVCDRRGGVDLILGGPAQTLQGLADAGRLVPIDPADPVLWRQVDRPPGVDPFAPDLALDPRDDSATLAGAKAVIAAEGWTQGYATLARQPVQWASTQATPIPDRSPSPLETVGLVRGGQHPDAAARFLATLTRLGWIKPAASDAADLARANDLLADLLGAALVDARNERRDAQMALDANNHPAIAEDAVGAAPPWPPASVAKLQADPARAALVDALAEQITPDLAARVWLQESWHGPGRRVDLDLLRQLSAAEGGRLIREPRFRAWLRGEWTAWTQQLYRRVARLAGGYRPS